MKKKTVLLTAGAMAFALATAGANAQLSTYYVTDGTSGMGMTHAWQGGVNTLNWTWVNNAEISIYTDGNFVRQVSYITGGAGSEYTLGGVFTGNAYVQGGSSSANYDAGFDGRSVYQVSYSNGNVARYDTSFGSEAVLFNTGHTFDSLGITFDGASGHIWTSGFSTGIVEEWDLAGNLISTFGINGGAAALAWDSQDDTLWLYNTSSRQHEQYSKAGALLSAYFTGTYVLGGEMAPIPAPASLALLGLGGLAATRRRRRA